jgi:hypothetical protein
MLFSDARARLSVSEPSAKNEILQFFSFPNNNYDNVRRPGFVFVPERSEYQSLL